MKKIKNIRYILVLSLSILLVPFTASASENPEENENLIAFSPIFSEKDGLLTVQYINNGGKDIGISIENESGVVFDAFYSNADIVFTNTYSFEDLEPGTYTFHITSKGVFYSYEFKLK